MRPIPPVLISAFCIGWLLFQPHSILAQDSGLLFRAVFWCFFLIPFFARMFGVRKQSAPLHMAFWALFITLSLMPRTVAHANVIVLPEAQIYEAPVQPETFGCDAPALTAPDSETAPARDPFQTEPTPKEAPSNL